MQLLNATPIEAVPPLTRSPSALHSNRSAPASAAAPTIFSTISVPATPRRPVACVEWSIATSSLTSTIRWSRSTSMSLAIWKLSAVAGVVLDDEAARRGRRRRACAAAIHLVGRRRGEHLARAGRVEHAEAHIAGVQRLMARAAAGHQRHRVLLGRAAADEGGSNSTRSRSSCADARPDRLSTTSVVDRVDEFLHRAVLAGRL